MARAPVLIVSTAILFILSVGLLFVAHGLGVDVSSDPKVPGYLEKTNWSLQAIFWPILAILIHLAWSQYVKAWRQLPSRDVIYRGQALDQNSSCVTDLVLWLEHVRPFLVALSVLLGLLLTAVDAGCLWEEYGVFGPSRPACTEHDFTIAFRLSEFSSVNQSVNGWFVVAAYLMQGALITYGWIALLELVVHSYCFWRFEHFGPIEPIGLKILLNYKDPLQEFGLSDVNRAINITYVFIAAGMCLPVLSAYWNPQPDLGQWLLRILLPLILLVPAAIPIAERMARIDETAERMRRDSDPQAGEQYGKQSLWPFEKTQIGYVGKIAAAIALGEYIFLITRNIKDIL